MLMKKVSALLGVSLALLLTPAVLPAQDDSSSATAFAPKADIKVATTPAPLTLGQKYAFAVKDTFDPAHLLLITTRAAVDQASNSPGGWGGGSGSYGMRVASRLGSRLVDENIAFGVAAVDHEERRYFRLGETSDGWTRTRHAVRRAFIAQSERGGEMPAYSNFIASFSTPFVAQTWRPGGVQGMRELRSGSIGIGMDAASNLWREFMPDFTRRRNMKKASNP
jgi:hypothetical protein